MGKAGKAKKRRKLESSTEDTNNEDLSGVIAFFEKLSNRLDLYSSKAFKALRIALHPLIEIQKSKHFEPIPTRQLSEHELTSIVSNENITSAIRISNHYSIFQEEFNDAELKPFRRALHPFVMYHFRMEKKLVGTGQLDANCQTSLETKGKISNRVSDCFRFNDYLGAYLALRQMARSEHESPKLGIKIFNR